MRLLAFGRLSHLPLNDVLVPPDVNDTASLRALLSASWPEIGESKVRIAVNQALVHGVAAISDGDEVAFLPPMSGG